MSPKANNGTREPRRKHNHLTPGKFGWDPRTAKLINRPGSKTKQRK